MDIQSLDDRLALLLGRKDLALVQHEALVESQKQTIERLTALITKLGGQVPVD